LSNHLSPNFGLSALSDFEKKVEKSKNKNKVDNANRAAELMR